MNARAARYRYRYRYAVLLAVAVTVLPSCVTRNSRFLKVDAAAEQGDFIGAAETLDRHADKVYHRRDAVLRHLDLGVLYHYAGDYDRSLRELQAAERLIEALFTRSITQIAGTLIVNDTVESYSGEDFEDIYLNVFNAVSYLELADFDAAFVEVRRINTKLNLLTDKYVGLAAEYNRAADGNGGFRAGKVRFHNSALARYLSMQLYRSTGDYDGARIDWNHIQDAFADQPVLYDFPLPLDESVLTRPDQARLSVLAFVGRAPLKRAEELTIATFTNQVVVSYAGESDEGLLIPEGLAVVSMPGVEGGYYFVFQMPRMELRGTAVTSINVLADGALVGRLDLLESLERVAGQTFAARVPIVYLRTVTRAVLKGIAAERAKQSINTAAAQSGSAAGALLGILGSVAADVAIEVSEVADLRTSRYFPSEAHVGEFALAPGTYTIEVEYVGANGAVLARKHHGSVAVAAGREHLVTSFLFR